MPITIGSPRSHHHKYKFIVEIDEFNSSRWQSVTGLEAEFDEVNYREGGSLIASKAPGLLNFTDLTLTRGATDKDTDLYTWYQQTADAAANAGVVEALFRRQIDIKQLDRGNNIVRKWRVFGAWPKKFVPGDWDNEASEVTLEQVILAYDYFEKVGREGSPA